MIPLLWHCPARLRPLVGLGILIVVFQWWFVPGFPETITAKWFWSLGPAGSFPTWFRLAFPLLLLAVPVHKTLGKRSVRNKTGAFSEFSHLGLITLLGGLVFWFLRVGKLELGDAKLIMDHFVSLTTYASVREPLESILHTDLARLLFFNWGIHPLISFQVLSCALGMFTLAMAGWGIADLVSEERKRALWVLFLFLVGPIHLFFGYVEWYTQLAAGLILFQVFSLRQWCKGKGLWIALLSFNFAACSHLVGLAFLPAALYLAWFSTPPNRRLRTIGWFTLFFSFSLFATLAWLKRHIRFQASVQATSALFATLLPLMREDNPNNPPGSWTYSWLCANHLGDLGNLLLLCGLFPILLILGGTFLRLSRATGGGPPLDQVGIDKEGSAKTRKDLALFFFLELFPCLAFLLLWNPWLGFPQDWDLFSFFAWPLLAFSLVMTCQWSFEREEKRTLLTLAGVPAFSIVFAWTVHYHHGSLQPVREWFVQKDEPYYTRLLQEARFATKIGDWPEAFQKVEKVMRESSTRTAECFDVFNPTTLQKMSEEWPPDEKLTPLAVDCEIIAASPMQRLLVLDCWGRVFFWEGGYFNDWAPAGIPGVPTHRAVDMEIVPWRETAVILRDDGDLYEVPISSWVDPNPRFARQTHFLQPPVDRAPRRIGNFYSDRAHLPLGRGQKAVDLALDYWHQRFIVLDTTGNLVTDTDGEAFDVTEKAALVRVDAEANYNGELVFTIDNFGTVNAWPGFHSPVQVILQHGWPAITDLELGRGGNDLYILDGQGAVFAFSRLGKPPIDPSRMRHFAPTGELLSTTPYNTEPFVLFIDLEIIPTVKAYFRMTRNFRIHYSESLEEPQ